MTDISVYVEFIRSKKKEIEKIRKEIKDFLKELPEDLKDAVEIDLMSVDDLLYTINTFFDDIEDYILSRIEL